MRREVEGAVFLFVGFFFLWAHHASALLTPNGVNFEGKKSLQFLTPKPQKNIYPKNSKFLKFDSASFDGYKEVIE